MYMCCLLLPVGIEDVCSVQLVCTSITHTFEQSYMYLNHCALLDMYLLNLSFLDYMYRHFLYLHVDCCVGQVQTLYIYLF